MANRLICIAGAAVLAGLIDSSAGADEQKLVRIPDQMVSARSVQPVIRGTLYDGEYAGVRYDAIPDASIPLPPEYQPEALLAKLDPTLVVESVGSLPVDGPKSKEEILGALPRTAFRLESLFAADGTYARRLGGVPIVVYVTGYRTSPAYTPSLEEVKEGHLEERRVFISGYNVSFGGLPPCSNFGRLCTSQAGR